jgi:hypothetical protein
MEKITNTPNSSIEDLLRQIWITKGSRFNAHRRLQKRGHISTLTINLLTAYILIISLVSIIPIFNLSPFQSQLISYSTSAMAIILLVLSVLEGAQEYSLKAERMHQCAIELSGLYNEIKIVLEKHSMKNNKTKFIVSSAKNYQAILTRTAENHDLIDYNYFQALHPIDFKLNTLKISWFKLCWFLRLYGVYVVLIWGPPIILFFLLFKQLNR